MAPHTLVVESLQNYGELSRASQRSVQAVSNLLASILESDHHTIKHAVIELLEETHSSTDECGTLFCGISCPHVVEAAARTVLRSWYELRTHSGEHHGQLFDSASVEGFGFVERSLAVRTALDTISVLVRDSDYNIASTFTPSKEEAKGRALGKYFERWLLDDAIPKIGPDAVERVNSALAAVFFSMPFVVKITELPVSQESDTAAFDTQIAFNVEDHRGRSMTFSDVVNVKYEKSDSTSPGNSGGGRMLAAAMLGTPSAACKQQDLTKAINRSLKIDDDYKVEDSDYWFWVFKREEGAAPVTEVHIASLLTIDPDAERAVIHTADGGKKPAIKHNMQQSFPSLQVDYVGAARRTRTTSTALEARDRLWNWYMPRYQERLRVLLEASGVDY